MSGQGEWRSDPQGKHEYRWWDGSSWTDQVADGGTTSVDPMTAVGSETVAIPRPEAPPAPGAGGLGAQAPAVPTPAASPLPPGVAAGGTPPPGVPGGPGFAAGAPGAPAYAPPAGKKSRPKWPWIVGGAVLGVVVLAVVLGAIFGTDSATDFGPGDCTNDSLDAEEISQIETVSCDDEHDVEAYGKFEADGDDFEAEDIAEQAQDECLGSLFEDYVGISYDESIYLANYLPPTEDTFDNGYHDVVCYIEGTTDGSDLEGSARDSEE